MSKTIITFVKNWRGYAAGEIAGFEAEQADALVDAGFAEAAKKSGRKPNKPPTQQPQAPKGPEQEPPDEDEGKP